MKKLLKVTAGDKTRTMNYIEQDDKILVLTLRDSKKIVDIKEDNHVELLLVGKDKKELDATAKIVDDSAKVKEIFDVMITENNSHFKTLDERLVAIEFTV